jgi:hypothetical protein
MIRFGKDEDGFVLKTTTASWKLGRSCGRFGERTKVFLTMVETMI